jgi:hypothetical protein
MKKIIAAFDGLKYSESTQSYAIAIAKQSNIHLVGVFMDDALYTSYKVYDLIVQEGISTEKLKQAEAKDKATRDASATVFEKACQHAGIEFSIHHDRNIALQALKHESMYADLLIINAGETLTHYPEKMPTRFIRDLLTDVQCPVIVVPQKYKPIQKICLLYDGAPSSMYAIKMFSYLLPNLKHLEVEVVSVKPHDASMHLTDSKLLKEFMKRHFPNAQFTVMKGWAEIEIVKHIKEMKAHSLIVLGAYRRGSMSRWFRESMADLLMKEVKLPLFIAHNK